METKKHITPKKKIEREFLDMGYNKKNIFQEYKIIIDGKKYIIDVAIISPEDKIAIECGMLYGKNKVEKLLKYFDKVIHYPYISIQKYSYDAIKIVYKPSQQQYDRVQKLMTSGRYRTQSELLRAILNIGLDKLEE